MSLNLTDDKSTLVQVMGWCHQATSHYLSQWWPRFLPPYGVTTPQKLLVRHDQNGQHFANNISNAFSLKKIMIWIILQISLYVHRVQWTLWSSKVFDNGLAPNRQQAITRAKDDKSLLMRIWITCLKQLILHIPCHHIDQNYCSNLTFICDNCI